MAEIERIIFWQPCVSPHTSGLLSEIAAQRPGVKVISCAHEGLLVDRKGLGWSVDDVSLYEEVIAPSKEEIRELIEHSPKKTLHILGGIRWIPTIVTAISYIKATNSHFAILQEPRVAQGLSGIVRRVQSILTEGWFRKHCSFVLGIGRNGPPWFESVGYSKAKVFPFAYFIPAPEKKSTDFAQSQKIRLCYVGRHIEMKGVEDIIIACSKLGNVELHIVGGGPLRDYLESRCKEFHIDYTFYEVLKNEAIGEVLDRCDVLLLPSREKDGWGVTISEGLLHGCAIITTNHVGASILCLNSDNGVIVPPNSPEAIASAVQRFVASEFFSTKNRLYRMDIARQTITSESGARYFWNVCDHFFLGTEKPAPFYEIGE